MIIARLTGGLGNQMFQYAAGRRLAVAAGAPLKLDLQWFENISEGDTRRRYELGVFNIREDFATPEEVEMLCGNGIRKTLKHWRATAWLGKKNYIRENVCCSKLVNPPALHDLYLDGFWQSEKYFIDIADIIRLEFMSKNNPDLFSDDLAKRIRTTAAVSVHVRRGDYVSNPCTAKFHGTCPPAYYRTAMEMISKHVREPVFYVFSDDPCWAAENLQFGHQMEFLNHNSPDKGYEDLRLMCLCQHHIIANSSFSWWGAWLSTNPDKLVIAPQKWFSDIKIDTSSLIPEKWIRI